MLGRFLNDVIIYESQFVHFFFQAEDGIRDGRVTGVQTCALPISPVPLWQFSHLDAGSTDYYFQTGDSWQGGPFNCEQNLFKDRKSTRLNSSHPSISYAVFCLKKKKKKN